MRKVIARFVDVKLIVTTIAVTFSTLYAAYTQIDNIIDKAVDRAYADFTEPTHTLVKHGLLKQLEKLIKDPEDIKRQDVEMYTAFCDGYFGKVYIPSQDSLTARGLRIACAKIVELYNQELPT